MVRFHQVHRSDTCPQAGLHNSRSTDHAVPDTAASLFLEECIGTQHVGWEMQAKRRAEGRVAEMTVGVDYHDDSLRKVED